PAIYPLSLHDALPIYAGIHVVPGLGAPGEDVGLGPEPARIVEGADANADDVGPCRALDIDWRAAVAAENPCDVVAGIGLGHVGRSEEHTSELQSRFDL